MSYSPYYTGGWQTGETGGTPITPAALNHMDSGIGANAAAAAEQAEDISDVNALLGNTSMGTTATTVTGAIKEHSNKIGNTSMGTTAQTLTGAIAEHEGDISALNGKWVVETKTLSVPNVAAGATQWVTSSIAKSGYTAVGAVGWYFAGGTANSFLFPYSMRVVGNNSSVAVRNLGIDASSGVSMQIDVLYQKT